MLSRKLTEYPEGGGGLASLPSQQQQQQQPRLQPSLGLQRARVPERPPGQCAAGAARDPAVWGAEAVLGIFTPVGTRM